MNKIITSHLVLVLAIVVSACGKDENLVKNVQQRFEEPSLMQTWQGPCKLKIFDHSARQVVRFAGDAVQEAYVLYEDEACEKGSVQVVFRGSLTLVESSESEPRKIETKTTTAHLKALSEKGAEVLGNLDACGVESWVINQEVDITAAPRGVACPFRTLPSHQFNNFTITKSQDGSETLYFGASGLFEAGGPSDIASLPKEVDKAQPFAQSTWSL